MRRKLLSAFSGMAAVAVAGSVQASLVVDNFTVGSINRSSSNSNTTSALETLTNPSYFQGSTGVRSAWVVGSLGSTGSLISTLNNQKVLSTGGGFASFETSVGRIGIGTTKSAAFVSYGGAGTDIDLSAYTSFDVAGSGAYQRNSTQQAWAYAFLTLTDTAGKTAVWKREFVIAGSNATLPVGNFSFNMALTQGLPTSPIVQAGFDIASIQKLTVNFETGVTSTSSSLAASYQTSWNYTVNSFTLVPAPGALALLGVAGLARRRRRG
jgi:hypothetical protein